VTKAKISEYSATAGDNTDVNGTNIAEGCPPSGINDAIREVMAALKRFETGADGDSVTVGGNLVVSGSTTANTLSTNLITEKTSAAGVTIDGVLLKDNGVVTGAGTVSAPVYSTTGDLNTGIFFPAADTIAFAEGGAEAMRINSSGNVGIGVAPSAWSSAFKVIQGGGSSNSSYAAFQNNDFSAWLGTNNYFDGSNFKYVNTGAAAYYRIEGNTFQWHSAASGTAGNNVTFTERARITSSGDFLVGRATADTATAGTTIYSVGAVEIVRDSSHALGVFRLTNDGDLVRFYQAGTQEGAISVSGSTVTYGGGHLARWGQLLDGSKDESFKKGTVLSNLDEMCVWSAPTTYWTEEDELPEGVNVGDVKQEAFTADNEQCNKIKVSDVEGDANVAGVFVSWAYDEQFNSNDLFVAMTGDMIIRIAQGVTVARGDLLMSAGDGTAKPQGDDIVRSKTIAKVTSTHVTCTYDDGSYCVPCVLMAC